MPTRFRLDHVVFFGRTEHDYEEMFALDLPALRGLRVLDCPSGPDAFVADAAAAGIDAVGCDPVYSGATDEIFTRARRDIDGCIAALRTANEFPTVDLDAFRQAKLDAFARFASDFAADGARERYRAASLPSLPFADRSFDLVLSANLLFSYSDPEHGGLLPGSPFDLAWHGTAIAEMLRVTRGEVRLYPTTTCDAQAKVHPFVEPLLATLGARGDVEASFGDSRYEQGLVGQNRFLRLRRVA
jgi:hypothetical protein